MVWGARAFAKPMTLQCAIAQNQGTHLPGSGPCSWHRSTTEAEERSSEIVGGVGSLTAAVFRGHKMFAEGI
jgi:hypothetical protein